MNKCEYRLLNLLGSSEFQLNEIFREYSNEMGFMFRGFNGKLSEVRRRELNNVLERLSIDVEKAIRSQVGQAQQLSDGCNDKLIKQYTKNLGLQSKVVEDMLVKNTGAVNAFLNRKIAGMNLSDRVWQSTKVARESLELLLESGVLNGRSAAATARDIQQYLKEPNRRYRRVRNAEGKLVLSNPAKEYHPGRGVYRSSFQNALRLSATETNIAYRANDFERRKKMSFVMGQRIQLSNAHPRVDICDYMVGTYPKNYKFTGWHPRCLCFSTSILLPKEKFKAYLGGAGIDKRHVIKGIPKGAQEYLNENAEQIKGWSNTPYFIKDNFQSTETGFKFTGA